MIKDLRNIPANMLRGQNTRGNARVDLSPVNAELRRLVVLAQRYQTGTPAKIDFGPLIRKLKEAEAIGYNLQAKAKSGTF